MPEGHSLVLAARRLAPIVGQPVTEGALSGAAIAAVEVRGKHLMIRSDDGRTLHVHLGMHGAVRLRPSGSGAGRHVLRTPAGDAVVHHPSRYAVRSTRLLQIPLGPDLLGAFDRDEYLRRARLVDRPVGEMLLDQRVLAGVGNVVKSEALWRCRVSPFAPVSALSDEAAGRAGRRLGGDPPRRGRRPAAGCPATCTSAAAGPVRGAARRSAATRRASPPAARTGARPARPSRRPECSCCDAVDEAVLLDRARGVLLGLAAGDALGAALEWLSPAQIQGRYGGPLRDMVSSGMWEMGEWTDDTAMMLALAQSLTDRDGYDEDDLFARYVLWVRSGPKDIGATVRGSLARARTGGRGASGRPRPTTTSRAGTAQATAR